MIYQPHFYEIMAKVAITTAELPEEIQNAVQAFDKSLSLLESQNKAIQNQWLPILEKSDAVISALIDERFSPNTEENKLDKIKQMALKAKALKAKWNTHA